MKGVLFDINDFWMIRSSGNSVNEGPNVQTALDEVPFGIDPWLEAATALCELLDNEGGSLFWGLEGMIVFSS